MKRHLNGPERDTILDGACVVLSVALGHAVPLGKVHEVQGRSVESLRLLSID